MTHNTNIVLIRCAAKKYSPSGNEVLSVRLFVLPVGQSTLLYFLYCRVQWLVGFKLSLNEMTTSNLELPTANLLSLSAWLPISFSHPIILA